MERQKQVPRTVTCPNEKCNSFGHAHTYASGLSSAQGQRGAKNSFEPHKVVRKGFYYRCIDRRFVRRFYCKCCRKTFSSATRSPTFRQHRPDVNLKVKELLCSSVSQRRIARLLQINLKTVTRKLLFLAGEANTRHEAWLQDHLGHFDQIQFDELETFEHTKCKPLSVPLVVSKESRFILGFDVCSMPAKGLLAKRARAKYGYRPDHRSKTGIELLKKISPQLTPTPEIRTDEKPNYPYWIRSSIKDFKHITFKGKRGCIVGQGELKKTGFDPLFDLNHTCAMLRANINRLVRKTWCTTKRSDRLKAHIALYVDYHNQVLVTSQ